MSRCLEIVILFFPNYCYSSIIGQIPIQRFLLYHDPKVLLWYQCTGSPIIFDRICKQTCYESIGQVNWTPCIYVLFYKIQIFGSYEGIWCVLCLGWLPGKCKYWLWTGTFMFPRERNNFVFRANLLWRFICLLVSDQSDRMSIFLAMLFDSYPALWIINSF